MDSFIRDLLVFPVVGGTLFAFGHGLLAAEHSYVLSIMLGIIAGLSAYVCVQLYKIQVQLMKSKR